mmetsp:Transcript_81663/g.264579  ORF Transcript_81663/g.264579 Transcript_81663/m.264579 type:complete len:206 (+) Transcript_81663:2825-3442(+)
MQRRLTNVCIAAGNCSKAAVNASVGTATTSAPSRPALAVLLWQQQAGGGTAAPWTASRLASMKSKPTTVSPTPRQYSSPRLPPPSGGQASTSTWPDLTMRNAFLGPPCSKTSSPGWKARTWMQPRRNSKHSLSRSAKWRLWPNSAAGSLKLLPWPESAAGSDRIPQAEDALGQSCSLLPAATVGDASPGLLHLVNFPGGPHPSCK